MNKLNMIIAATASLNADAWGLGNPERKIRHAKKVKVCLHPDCNTEHTHNNSFCSSECCKGFKSIEGVK
mgnify:CR=1 FL=1